MRFLLGKGEITLFNFGAAFLLAKTVSISAHLIFANCTRLDANLSTLFSRSLELVCVVLLLIANFLPNKFPIREIIYTATPAKISYSRHQIFLVVLAVMISRYVMELVLMLPYTLHVLGPLPDGEQLESAAGFASIPLIELLMSKKLLAQITVVPFVEEIIYRGILLNLLLSRMNVTKSVVFSSIAFAVLHSNPVTAFLGGLLFAHIYIITRNLWLCMLGHACANITVIFLNGYGDYVYPSLNSTSSIMGPNVWLCAVLTFVWLSGLSIATIRSRHVYLKSAFPKPSLKNDDDA